MSRIPDDILERLSYFQREVEKLFRRLFEDELGAGPLREQPPELPADVLETDAEVVVQVDLPGVDRSAVELYGAPNFLVLRGAKRPEGEKWPYLRVERAFGPFQRLVVLPAQCDPSRMRARYDRGVLEVRVPKVVDRRLIHRQIPIE
ncbi:MAG: Hsp20/alpha crystallin family protein [Deferrisomatales bacterium]